MNINEYIARKEKEIEIAKLVNEMALIHKVSHISDNTVFFNPNIDIEQTRRVIRPYCGNETLKMYYMTGDKKLALVYQTPDNLEWILFVTGTQEELQETLDQISLGKCKIKQETTHKEETYISCGVE